MISLSSEMTDAKGRQAPRGWVFFDRDCSICTSLARRFRHTLERRGFALAALQDPRVAALLGLAPDQLLREMRVVIAEGKIYGGAEAIGYLSGQIWWVWPVFAAAQLPGVPRIIAAGYRWFAHHRHCVSGKCSVVNKSQESELLSHTEGKSG
jgi:predicted DCC family thiol-disulfide oxidoreductase YuxK